MLFSRMRALPEAREGGSDAAMRVAVAADHAGVGLKQHLAEWLQGQGHEVLDFGTHSTEPVDYPDYAEAVGQAVLDGRAGLCHDTSSAAQVVLHDDVNVLVLGSRVIGPALAESLVTSFLAARFTNAERHVRRLNKIKALEARALMHSNRIEPS